MDYLLLEYGTYGYGHILIITDVFMKFAFAVTIKNDKALTVAKVLAEKIIQFFVIPECLLSDRGRNCESVIIKQLCKLHGIERVFTCPYSLRSDAVCEWNNLMLIDMLGTLVEEELTWLIFTTAQYINPPVSH